MRAWFSVIAIVAALVYVEPALADTPAAVYSDFAQDGLLSCAHSRSALKGILQDASLYQYGDPLTFVRLKLAVRRQLVRGCDERQAADPRDTASSETPAITSRGTEATKRAAKKHPRGAGRSELAAKSKSRTPQSEELQRGGAMVILGVGLLLLALGSAGWAAKRAFTT